MTLSQLEPSDVMRGRTPVVYTNFIGASDPLDEFASGFAAASVGAVIAAVSGGLSTMLVVLRCCRLFPQLAKRDHMAFPA